MNKLQQYLRDDRGASAAEFALVTVPFFGLVLAIIGGAMMFYSNQSLQYATQKAARYYSVQTTNANGTPPTTTVVQTYAKNAYTGPGISPTFTAARGGCGANGFQVTANATFPLNTGLINLSVPLKAHACFP
ncbi:MAG: TadE family protein [Pseudomonadota bacterium]